MTIAAAAAANGAPQRGVRAGRTAAAAAAMAGGGGSQVRGDLEVRLGGGCALGEVAFFTGTKAMVVRNLAIHFAASNHILFSTSLVLLLRICVL